MVIVEETRLDLGENGKNGSVVEEAEEQFLPGDIVLAKVKGQLWWPARVHSPDDSSPTAIQCREPGKLLMAFYGDHSAAWVLPSEVLPLVGNLASFSTLYWKLSRIYKTSGFPKAVREALYEVGRLVQGEMVCRCIPEDRRGGLARPLIDNAGVRKGVLAPEVDINRLGLPKFEAADVLEKVEEFARGGRSGVALVDVGVLRGWLTAFYRYKGCHRYELESYSQPVLVEGLEDKEKTVKIDLPRVKAEKPAPNPGNGSSSRQRKKSRYLSHPYVFQGCGSVKKRKQLPDSLPMLSSAVDDPDSTANGDLVADVKDMMDKLAATLVILQNNQSKFSAEEKSRLTKDFRQLGEQIEMVIGKVGTMCRELEDTSS